MRIQLLPAIVLILMSVLVDIYILLDIRKTVSPRNRNKASWVYAVSALLCWILVIVFLAWPKRNPDDPIVTPMWLLFIYLSIYIPKFLYCLLSLIGRLFCRREQTRKKWDIGFAVPMSVLACVVMWIGVLMTRNQIVVNEVEISSAKLPESMDGMTILQFSDLHAGTWGNDTSFVSRMVDSINSRNVDIVVFTGDFVNRTASELTPFLPVLKRIKARREIYAILGNHDYGGYADWADEAANKRNLSDLDGMIESLGWKLLKNKSDMIHNGTDSIAMIGVENWGEPPFNQLGDLVQAYESAGKSKDDLNDGLFKILLTHNPNHWSEVVREMSNVDLTMSGHTHAMQMAFEGFGGSRWSPAVWKYPQWGGLYEGQSKAGEPMYLYVNVGVGEVGYPARFGNAARPELNVITLRSSSAKKPAE